MVGGGDQSPDAIDLTCQLFSYQEPTKKQYYFEGVGQVLYLQYLDDNRILGFIFTTTIGYYYLSVKDHFRLC